MTYIYTYSWVPRLTVDLQTGLNKRVLGNGTPSYVRDLLYIRITGAIYTAVLIYWANSSAGLGVGHNGSG